MPAPSRDARYRHIFWDMGGTIVNTYPGLDAALAGVVRAHGDTIDDHDVALLTRRSTGAAITALSRRFGIPETMFREAEARLKQSWRDTPPPAMPGIHEAMAAISGLNLVVTHRDRRSATALLEALDIHVDDMACAPDGHPRKPSPAMHVELLGRHGLDPRDCVGVGDRPLDATAARAAGMHAVMLRTPRISLDNEADLQVESLGELLPWLA
ncbi:HAD family hydrolase [Tessaracoccus antarcticus]|uniref:HAD family hydrolase n=1 Tax=Tessaracoccus antarcticus TaxID=2479848 RepID=A0A3M0GGA9_9ACTN|nr:HAD family hydrolase [Tessaracoccus antarcticus]RMB61742.1 HAD family hydrolase [Tessaracoccus antarcticus]